MSVFDELDDQEIKEYFTNHPKAIINYNHGWHPNSYITPNRVSFLDLYSFSKQNNQRPIIDSNGDLYYIDGNYFTESCDKFRWNTIENLEFARKIKDKQKIWMYFNQSGFLTCSCECRIEGNKYAK